MGTCWNCSIQITLKEERTKCDNCGETLWYKCNSCKKEFKIEDKEKKKKLRECKLCGYFFCPECNACSDICARHDWEIEVLKILKPEILPTPNVLGKVKQIIHYFEEEKGGSERRICPQRKVLISYAKNRLKTLLAKMEGFRVKDKRDMDAFIERIDEVTEKPIGSEIKISDVREDGTYGQEYRDALNLLVCMGKFEIVRKSFTENNKKIVYDVYRRCEKGICPLLNVKDLIFNECPTCKTRYDLQQDYCSTCPPFKKGKNKGEQRKLNKRLNDKDTCQLYRGNFIKQENGKS